MSRAYAPTPRRSAQRSARLCRSSTTRPRGRARRPGGHLVIAVCAEQGFAGTFNRRVLDVAERALKADGDHARELIVLGARGVLAADERGLAIGWSRPMIAHVAEVGALADRVTEQLYARIGSGRATRVNVIHATPSAGEIEVVDRSVAPFDFARFPRTRTARAADHFDGAAGPADAAR